MKKIIATLMMGLMLALGAVGASAQDDMKRQDDSKMMSHQTHHKMMRHHHKKMMKRHHRMMRRHHKMMKKNM